MPIVDEKAPRECDFDAMLTELKGTDQNTACVFNCQVDISPHLIRHYLRDVPQPSCVQMGKGRTTTGMIVACLVRDVLGGAVPSHKPMMADKNELPDEEEFLEEQHRWGEQISRYFQYLIIYLSTHLYNTEYTHGRRQCNVCRIVDELLMAGGRMRK